MCSATSNARGEFTFDGLPLGRYDLKVETPAQFEGETRALDLFHGTKTDPSYPPNPEKAVVNKQ